MRSKEACMACIRPFSLVDREAESLPISAPRTYFVQARKPYREIGTQTVVS